jgi:superfamily II DNA helicase RecQ
MGDSDKLLSMDNFSNGLYPIILTTMALGLGRNLKRVRCVIDLGRGDPFSIVQMVGRCCNDLRFQALYCSKHTKLIVVDELK